MRIANSPLRRTRNRAGEWHLWKRLPWKLHSNRRTGPLAKKRTVPLARCFRSWASVGSLSLAIVTLGRRGPRFLRPEFPLVDGGSNGFVLVKIRPSAPTTAQNDLDAHETPNSPFSGSSYWPGGCS
jgi:hypothetical protein